MQGQSLPSIQFLRREVPIRLVFDTAKAEGITADQLVGVALEVELSLVRLTFATRRLDAAADYRIPSEAHPEILSVLPLNVVTFLETTKPIDFRHKAVQKVISALSLIRDRLGRYPVPIYCAGRGPSAACQYAMTSTKRIIRLHETGNGGITSIRHDQPRNRLVGIRVDTSGMGLAIAAMPYDHALNRPFDMEDQSAWRDICSMPGSPLISLSRPCAAGKNGRFYLNMAYDQRGLISFSEDGSSTHISVFSHQHRIIGAPGHNNPHTIVQYTSTPKGTDLQIAPVHLGTNSPLIDAIL